jgi:endonuclease III
MTLKNKQAYAQSIDAHLKQLFPQANMILRYSNNWELMVAVQLSAQCTDVRVNIITKKLFKKYKTLAEYCSANTQEFEQDIFQAGYYKNKTKNILAAAKMIRDEFNGEIPNTMEEILRIPGVARKTANVVLGNAYGVVEGIAVDTHVARFAHVYNLSQKEDRNKIEEDLKKLIPKEDWFLFTYRVIEYGRKYCKATKHDHETCPLRTYLKKVHHKERLPPKRR